MIKVKSKKTLLKISNVLRNKYVFTLIMMCLLFAFFFVNITQIGEGKYSLDKIFRVLRNPSVPYDGAVLGTSNPFWDGITRAEYLEISNSIWASISAIIAAVGLSLAGLVTQSLTRNPLADGSTLGLTQASIFGVILALSFGYTEYHLKFLFALIGGGIASLLLIIITTFSKGKSSVSKIVLAGLAIGIIFKTISFLVRKGDKFLSAVSYTYVLGGSEGVVQKGVGTNQWLTLYISSGLIGAGLILTGIISRGMTLLELGEERAKNLGVKVKTVKLLSIVIVIITVPSAVMIAGNIAFIGLFSVHISRYFTKSRDYRTIMFPAIIMAAMMSSMGLTLTTYIPKINSGLWMTFIGAPYLIYAGIRGLK